MATFWKDFLMGNTPTKKPPPARKDAPKRRFGRTASLAALRPRASPERERPPPRERTHEHAPPLPARSQSTRDVTRLPARASPPPACPPAGPLRLAPDRLDSLLDTLTTRELQLSLRVERAEEAVVSARDALRSAPAGTPAYASARRRAVASLRRRRALETSLAVTTQQADRVLQALGRRGIAPVEERVADRMRVSRARADAAADETAAVFRRAVAEAGEADVEGEIERALSASPDASEDWVEAQRDAGRRGAGAEEEIVDERREGGSQEGAAGYEGRAQEGRRRGDARMDGRAEGARRTGERRDRRQERDHIDPRVAHAGDPGATTAVMPEEAGRMSVERLRAKIPKGSSFSRRRRGDKKR